MGSLRAGDLEGVDQNPLAKVGRLILNVGCGEQAYGDVRIDKYRGSANVICEVERPLPFRDETFDEVYSRYVFEHLRNPSQVLSEMARVAKSGGRVVVVTDNASCFSFHVTIRRLGWGIHVTRGWSRGEDDLHYAVYTPMHLENHLRWCGLRDVTVRYAWTKELGGPQGRFQGAMRALRLHRIPLLRPFVMPVLVAIGTRTTSSLPAKTGQPRAS